MPVQKVYLLNQNTPVIIPSGLVPKGAYNGATDYAVGDTVDYLGSSYVMHVDAAAGTLPTDTTKWQVLAEKGDKGDTGATGAAGVVQAVTDGAGIDVDSTDPASPIVSLDPASIASLALADSAVQNLSDLSITSTAAELNYTDGVTSAIQTQLDGKSATSHTHTAADTTDFDTEVSNNTDVAANTAARHTHANSAVLDATTASFTTADETKLDGIAIGAQVNTVTSVNTRTGAVTGLAEASDVTTALDGKFTQRTITGTTNQISVTNGDGVSGNPTLSLPQNIDTSATPTFSSLTAGTDTDVLGTALSVIRNNVEVGRIDNNASGLRVQAKNGSLQLRGTGNTGIAIDASGNAVVAGTITGANLSGTNTGDQPLGSRTITGTADEITVTNGSGASGNPTLSLALTAAKVGALPIPDPGSFYPTDTITAALQLIGGRERYGTGSPEGVVTAPVGVYYTDTAITNGAMRWAKKAGTGNTGWKVIHGDTGWRRITSFLNGWTGQLDVRRINDELHYRTAYSGAPALVGTAATARVFLAPNTLGAGMYFTGEHRTINYRAAGAVFGSSYYYHTGWELPGFGTASDTYTFPAGSFFVIDAAWPTTTLPGVAV